MRLLITGGAGFIGCNFVRQILVEHPDYEIVVLDKLTSAGWMENLLMEITRMILSHLKKPESMIEHVADRLGHDFRYSVDARKIRDLGWRPKRSFEDALSETLQWYMKNEGWWSGLL